MALSLGSPNAGYVPADSGNAYSGACPCSVVTICDVPWVPFVAWLALLTASLAFKFGTPATMLLKPFDFDMAAAI